MKDTYQSLLLDAISALGCAGQERYAEHLQQKLDEVEAYKEPLIEASMRALHELEIEHVEHDLVTYPQFWKCDKSTEKVIEDLRKALTPYNKATL